MTGGSGWRLAAVCLLVIGCRQVAGTVFDIPPKSGEERPATVARVPAASPLVVSEDTVRPPIEGTLNADSATAMLPRDHAGNIDWMAALRDGVIKPRSAIAGRARHLGEPDFRFAFDFYLQGPDSTFDAYFPHSSHTEWVDCRQCHGPIFRYRGTNISMADIFQGRYCGECHGKVAYPVNSGCERCHQSLPMPPDRAQPELLGTVTMRRVSLDSAALISDSIGNSAGVRTDELPPAIFPHWLHRVRFRCKACHVDLFEPRAGATAILMKDINAGEACGACHNGAVAFRARFGNCQRCHVSNTLASR